MFWFGCIGLFDHIGPDIVPILLFLQAIIEQREIVLLESILSLPQNQQIVDAD